MKEKMRIYHRYLGFFLSGIMAVYAISGIILIFRDTDFLKKEKVIEKQLAPNLTTEDLGKEIRIRELKIDTIIGTNKIFRTGSYDSLTGTTRYTVKDLPFVVQNMTNLHKASSKKPLFFLNIFFGVSLLFFVISAFYMFLPKTSVFKKGLYFAGAGMLLTLILLFI